MLVEFRVENHRSLRDEQVFTMEAGRVGDETDPRPRHISGHTHGILPVAAFYGANASGKSNVLAALAFMRLAVFESHRNWAPGEGVPRDPFAWGHKKNESSLFEVKIVINGVPYQYGFVATDDRFIEEWLFAWPHGKKQLWFERDCSDFKFGENLKGENKLIEEVTRPNALFLSVAVQHRHEQLQPVFAWFQALRPLNLALGRQLFWRGLHGEHTLARLLDEDSEDVRQQKLFQNDARVESLSARFRTMLRNADIGVVDVRVDRSEPEESPRRPRIVRFHLKHHSGTGDAWLPLEEESRGTQTLFRIALPILQAIEFGGTLIIDELEASLHPSLAQQIVRQFNDPKKNPNNAQLIFTTHDTNLLGTTFGQPALRRDQVWLTEKDPEGATVLYPLTDYQPRKAENLERGYIQGRYGAIPFLGNFSLWGE